MGMITSTSNKQIVEDCKLKDKKYRDLTGKFLVEGYKLIEEGIKAGFEIDKIYSFNGYFINFEKAVAVSENVINKLSELKTPQKDVAVFYKKELQKTPDNKYALLLDRIQDPKNVGAILRSAAASGFDYAYLVESADPYSQKAIRASMGGVFKVGFESLQQVEVLDKIANYYVIVADMDGENVFKCKIPKQNVLLCLGNEGQGLADYLMQRADKTLSIPMKNNVESLNAAVSASILMYEIAKEEI